MGQIRRFFIVWLWRDFCIYTVQGKVLYLLEKASVKLWAFVGKQPNTSSSTQVYPRESVCVYAPDPRVWLEM
jgi:hypothetical protein